MSDTPRTDALLLEINEGRVYETDGPTADLCRQLERDMAGLREKVIEYHEVNAKRCREVQQENESLGNLHTANSMRMQANVHESAMAHFRDLLPAPAKKQQTE